MQPNKAYNSKNMTMVMPYHPHPHPHPHHEYLLSNSNSGSSGVEKGTSTGGGSLFSNTISNQFASMSNNIYDVVGADVSSVMQTSLSFASSAGGMTNVNVRVPFTTAQRQELQRQTTIYKYIISSVPVPHQLLVPISNSTAPSNQSTRGSLELGISNSCTDPEPWRCRRTDGKKWRCSRDVILDQKYCERHSHKCRSRSRKPVELNHHFNYNNNSSNNSPYSKSNFLNLGDKDKNKNKNNNHQSSSSISSTGVPISATSHDQFRGLEWFMKGENFPFVGSNQELQQMMNAKLGLSRDANDCDPNSGIPKQQEQHEKVFFNLCGDDQSSLLVIPKLTPFELGTPSTHQTTQETRHFIDAWSTPVTERDHHHVGGDFGNGCCGSSSNEELSFSSLTLAMCGGNDYETNNDHENQNVERGFGQFGNMGSEGSEQVENMKSDQSQWFNPVSWMGSAPGGPLAEALCLGIAGSTREPSSRGCNSSGTTSSRSSC